MPADPDHLEQLVMDDELDQVFELVSVEDAARAWCAYTSRMDDEGFDADEDPDEWAILLIQHPDLPEDRYREMLIRVVELAPDDEVLGVAGAGPLEDFAAGCGEWTRRYEIAGANLPEIVRNPEAEKDRLHWVEQQAAASEKFRKALGHVWVKNHLDAATVARLARAAGVESLG